MKKLLFIMAALSVIFVACQKEQDSLNLSTDDIFKDIPDECAISTTLIVDGSKYDENGKGTIIGTVNEAIVAGNVEVTYQITEPGWRIDETYLYVGEEESIPFDNSGNPFIKKFPYILPTTGDENKAFYRLQHKENWGKNFVVAASAKVSFSSLKALTDEIPSNAKMSVFSPGDDTYYKVKISNGGLLDGEHNGWCIDILGEIDYPYTVYDANVYSSNADIPASLVDYPENLDLVNWLLNQNFIGQNSQGCEGEYNWQDMQMAFWYLLNKGTANEPAEEGSNPCRVSELIFLAETNGENFIPVCMGKIAVILEPRDGAQVCIIEWTLEPCHGEEIAWAYGYRKGAFVPGIPGMSFTFSNYYGGQNWGWYFYSCSWEK